MKNLDLNTLGLQELSNKEVKNIEGGGVLGTLIGFSVLTAGLLTLDSSLAATGLIIMADS